MRNKLTKLTLFCLLLCSGLETRAAEPSSSAPVAFVSSTTATPQKADAGRIAIWPQDVSDLKADSSAVWGRLDNGLRYVILPARGVPGRASLRLYMNVGSMMETEDQQGLAHYLEHMAFNGTRHFPAGELVKYFQRLGMNFGPHANAFTSWDQTVYKLELPRAEVELLGDGMKVFRDFLDGMLLDPREIDRERRVIFSEILARNSSGYRATAGELKFILPDTLVPRRTPLGQAASVRALAPSQFVDFYENWYTPGRAVVVAVGDLDAKKVEELIRQNFADAKARRGEQPDPPLGKIAPLGGPLAGFHTEADAPGVSIELSNVLPATGEPDSVARLRRGSVRGLLNTMLNLRLRKLATSKNAPLQGASAGFECMFNLAEVSSLSASCQPAQWQAALAGLEQELRRAIEFGFSDAEFAQARSMALASFQAAADEAETRQAASLADEIVASLVSREVFTHPADELTFEKNLLPNVKKEECQALLRKTWDPRALRIWVHGNLQLGGDASRQILAAYGASHAIAVQAPQDEQITRLTFASLGPAGKIVGRQQVADLDFVEATLSNHIRVDVKRTNLEKNKVHVLIHFGGGMLEEPADKPGLGLMSSVTFIRGGLKALNMNQLQQNLADKDLGLQFSVADDAFQLDGTCAPSLLEMELQLCAAYLTAPGYRDEARDQFLAGSDSMYAQLEHTPEGMLNNGAFSFLRSGDPRFSIPAREVLKKLTMKDVQAWLAEPLRTGYMEVVIVGDVDAERALQLTATTLGALPERAAAKPAFARASKIQFPAAPKLKEFRFDSPTPRAISMVCWATPGPQDKLIVRQLCVLQAVLDDRLRIKVRQELGATYTPQVAMYSNDAYPDYGYIAAVLIVDPKRITDIGPLVAKIGDNLASGTISDDEFARALKPIVVSWDTLDNNYWVGLLTDCQAHPECLDSARRRKSDFKSITKADIEALAKKYLSAGKATIINVAPK
jgi:zinc protease